MQRLMPVLAALLAVVVVLDTPLAILSPSICADELVATCWLSSVATKKVEDQDNTIHRYRQ
jgi:hypothetical protein